MNRVKTILLMGVIFILNSCDAGNQTETDHNFIGSGTPPPVTAKYLALGDSYTIGEAVTEDQRFPVQLQQKLSEAGVKLPPPEIIARTGWTTDELAENIRQVQPRCSYALVSLLIGVNNQYRGRDTAEYRLQFRDLLQTAADLAGGNSARVIVVSIPDYAYTPFGQGSSASKISQEIDQFNLINLQETRKTSAVYIDITPISRKGLTEPELVAADKLHPSGAMYRLWTELMLPEARRILRGW